MPLDGSPFGRRSPFRRRGVAALPPVGAAAVTFGNLDLIGQGGIAVPGIGDGDYGNFTVSAGLITPRVNNPLIGTYVYGDLTVVVKDNWKSVRNQTEWNALTSALYGKTILVRQSAAIAWDQSTSNPSAFGRDANMANTVVQGDGPDPRLSWHAAPDSAAQDHLRHFRHIKLTDCQRLTIQGCRIVPDARTVDTETGEPCIRTNKKPTRLRILNNLLVASRPKPSGDYTRQVDNVTVTGTDGAFPGGAGIQNAEVVSYQVVSGNIITGAGQGVETFVRWYNEVSYNRLDLCRNDFIQIKGASSGPFYCGGNYTSRPMYGGNDGHRDSIQVLGGSISSVIEAHAHFDGDSIGACQVAFLNTGLGFRVSLRDMVAVNAGAQPISINSGLGTQVARYTWVPPTDVSLPTTRGGRQFQIQPSSVPGANVLRDSLLADTGLFEATQSNNLDTRARDAAGMDAIYQDRTFGGVAMPTMKQLFDGARTKAGGPGASMGNLAQIADGAGQAYTMPHLTAPTLSAISVANINQTTAELRVTTNNDENAIFWAVQTAGSTAATMEQILNRDAVGGVVYGHITVPDGMSAVIAPLLGLLANTGYVVSLFQKNGLTLSSAVSTVSFTTATTAQDRAPQNTVLPTILGTMRVGQTLTAVTGTWINSPTSYAYRWLRNLTVIPGETGATYIAQAADIGAEILVEVTAVKAGHGGVAATSLGTNAVQAATGAIPINTVLPSITGTAQTGQTLTASTGTWSNTPTSYAYQWLAGSTAIPGAEAATFVPDSDQLGQVLRVTVTATNATGSASAQSAATAAVSAAAALPENTVLPVVTGSNREGQTLTSTTGTWTNSPTGYAYQWLRNGAAIAGATGTTYVLTSDDVDAVVAVQVIASNAFGAATTPAISAATAQVEFAFELLTATGSPTITAVDNMRVSLDAGATWLDLTTAGLTVARHADGDKLVVSGWASNAVRDAALFHYEKRLTQEPNWAGETYDRGLYVKAASEPAPVSTAMPGGMQLCATVANQPVGVS